MTHFDASATLEFLDSLEAGAGPDRMRATLSHPDLAGMLRAFGLTPETFLPTLRRVAEDPASTSPESVDSPVEAYVRELVTKGREVRALADRLRDSAPRLAEEAYQRTRAYLPTDCPTEDLRLVLLPLGYDYRTDRATVYMDPLISVAYGENGIRHTLAHELHHVARYRITRDELTLMRPDAVPSPTTVPALLQEWARWLEAEGIADCASNMTQWDVPLLREAVRMRLEQEADYASLLAAALGEIPDPRADVRPERLAELRENLRWMAHPVGHAMAQRIEQTLGARALIDSVGKPRQFLEHYNDVADRTGQVPIDVGRFGWEPAIEPGS